MLYNACMADAFDKRDMGVGEVEVRPARADEDFIPLVEFLETRGIKILHAAFPPQGAHLSRVCWGSIDLPGLRTKFER